MNNKLIYINATEFDWDSGNSTKNWEKHHVSQVEAESVFFNIPLLVFPDVKHSDSEKRMYCLGKTDQERYLFIAFVLRNNIIKVISARDMTDKEFKGYSNYEKRNS